MDVKPEVVLAVHVDDVLTSMKITKAMEVYPTTA